MRDQFTNFATTATTTLAESIDTANVRALDAVVDANRRFVEFAVSDRRPRCRADHVRAPVR